MPDLDLAALSRPELRNLLGSARERGDAALSYEILKEMAARREPRSARSRRRSRGEPRIVSVDLGDPAERKHELPPLPAWRPAPQGAEAPAMRAAPAPGAEPAAEQSEGAARPIVEPPVGADPEPERADSAPGPTVAGLPGRRRRSTRAGALALSAAVGAAGGVALGWGLGAMSREARPAVAAPASARVVTITGEGQQVPAPMTLGAPAAARPAAPRPPAAETPDDDGITTAPASQVPPSQPPAGGDSACAVEPTPADRTICRDPELRRLQRRLRKAYAEALEAHRDKALLRERQLAWREARNETTDPERLASTYEQRIQRLKAATADARKRR